MRNSQWLPQEMSGTRLRLRLVRTEDAGYIHSLRTDPTYNTHLSTFNGTVDDQRRWIEAYKVREGAGQEGYYMIERLSDGVRCGLVRLYGIEGDHFTWGSWILDTNKPHKAALESAVLIYKIGFELLGLSKAVFDVRRRNTHTVSFHRRFGATEVASDDVNFYFDYPRARFESERQRYLQLLGWEKQE